MAGEGSYFVDHKRGEVMELKGQLRNTKLDKDPSKKRDVIKKVIAYMTLGIDVSTLFSDMVMATTTRDLVQKKMVYLYLCTYAESKQDLAILAVNTLQRDCRDDDPMVRGLALRSLCSLRLNNLVEYVMTPIRNGLTDGSAYVRKIAVMGVAQLFTIAPQLVKESDFIDILYNMIKDKDSEVVQNSINALNEILIDEGGMAVNQIIVAHLLKRLHTFNEWGQAVVLSLVAKYKPTGPKEEIFDIMNLLEDRLRHSNSAIVLGTAEVFLKLTENMPNVHKEVYKRIKTPILTLTSSPNFSISFPVLAHVLLIVKKCPGVFDDSYKDFFCRYSDPLCIKDLKVQILTEVANDSNVNAILGELSQYTTDVDVEIARLSIRSIGRLAIKVPASLDQAIQHLLSFLDMSSDYVIGETCVCCKNILRKYPDRYEHILPSLKDIMRNVEEKDGKCATLWLLGEFGDHFIEAPYILEQYIDRYNEEESSEVKLELLTSAMKLFFKKPPEVQKMLGRLLKASIADTTKIDVRDRAVFYFKLLQYNVNKAEKIINCPKVTVDAFADEVDMDLVNRIYDEFNTIAVVYQKPSALFVNIEPVNIDDEEEEEEVAQDNNKQPTADKAPQSPNENEDVVDDYNKKIKIIDDGDAQGSPSPPANNNNNNNNNKVSNDDLLGIDLLGIDAPSPQQGPLLRPNPQCTPQLFQQSWKQLPVSNTINRKIKSNDAAKQIESLCNQVNFKTQASGGAQNVMKFYFYGQETLSENLHFVECIADLNKSELRVTIKGQSDKAKKVSDLFESTLSPILI